MAAKLPSGRELTLLDVIKFCYDLSETDLELLFKLLTEGRKTIEEISIQLSLSKATISRSLNKLLGLGFIERQRVTGTSSIGRPKYIYGASKERIEAKLRTDIEYCVNVIRDYMGKLFKQKDLIKL